LRSNIRIFDHHFDFWPTFQFLISGKKINISIRCIPAQNPQPVSMCRVQARIKMKMWQHRGNPLRNIRYPLELNLENPNDRQVYNIWCNTTCNLRVSVCVIIWVSKLWNWIISHFTNLSCWNITFFNLTFLFNLISARKDMSELYLQLI